MPTRRIVVRWVLGIAAVAACFALTSVTNQLATPGEAREIMNGVTAQ